MNSAQLPRLRETLLTIMDAIHEVCEKNNIRYYIIGGTALGAVRHGGFIPWDTDIDIAMRREEYDLFLKIANEQLADNFYCASYLNEKKWYHPHALVFDKTTMIHWNRSYYKKITDCPVYIDVFPLDYAPDDTELQLEQEKEVRRKIYLQSRRECILYQRNGLLERIEKKAYSAFLHFTPDSVFNESLDNAMKKYSAKKTSHLCSMSSHYSYKKQFMPVEFYGDGKLYDFEGRKYRGPDMIDSYLSQLYGDYMRLPPEEERTEHMDYIDFIDFNALC